MKLKIKHHKKVVNRAERALRKQEMGGFWVLFWGMTLFSYAMWLMCNQYGVQ